MVGVPRSTMGQRAPWRRDGVLASGGTRPVSFAFARRLYRCAAMLMPDSPLEPQQMLALSYAFDGACGELSIGQRDVANRKKTGSSHSGVYSQG
jgi:hypothetical protein